MWPAALDRQTWDQVRAVLLNPERNTNVRKATRYLLTGLTHCGGCGGALFSRPRNNTRRYLCAGRRPGHQLGIIADPVDELVKEFVLRLPTTPSVRETLLAEAGAGDDGTMGRTLADLGAAQSRLQALDDDFYVRGVLPRGGTDRSGSSSSGRSTASTGWWTPPPSSGSSCTAIPVRSGRAPTSNSGGIWFD